MLRRTVPAALAERLCLPELRARQELPSEHPPATAVLPLQAPDLGDRRHHLRLVQAAADGLVPGDPSSDPDEKRRLGDATAPTAGNPLQRRMAHEAQADAGDGRARSDAAPAGLAQLDDAYLGGERTGGRRGRGAAGKTPFVAAVQTSGEGHPQRVKLSAVRGFRKAEIAKWAKQRLAPGSHAVSDGLACFDAVTQSGCTHEAIVSGGGRAAVEKPEFYWVNTVLGNLKSALRSSYHSFEPKYAQRYLAEFEYRFNRRYSMPDMIPRLAYVALRTPPLPERLLKHGLC